MMATVEPWVLVVRVLEEALAHASAWQMPAMQEVLTESLTKELPASFRTVWQRVILEVVQSLVPSVVPTVGPRRAQIQVFKEVLVEALAEALTKSPRKEVGVRLRALVELAPLVVVLSLRPWVVATLASRPVQMQVLDSVLAEEPARGLLAVVMEDLLAEFTAKEVPVIFPTVGQPVLLEVELLLLVPWTVAAVVSRAVPIQVKVQALVEVSALGLLAVLMGALQVESPAKEVPVTYPAVGRAVLLQVVMLLVAWEVVSRAARIQVSRRPGPVVPPINQTQRQLQEQPLEPWPQQRQWLP